ncbi:MAG: PHB depolymerase family esterase [Planctomycetota bacterium]
MTRETGFLNRQITLGGRTRRYMIYVPPEWRPTRRWPVLLFLHGSGERGNDGICPTQVGIGGAIRRFPNRYPCLVVFPQSPRSGHYWNDPATEAVALAALDRTIREFRGDPARVTLTGISMGGYGTWRIAAKFPGRFARIAPVCGGVRIPARYGHPTTGLWALPPNPYAAVASRLGKLPVWIFHGSADTAIPVMESRRMAKALRAAKGRVRYTEYRGVDHNSWDAAYSDPAVARWLCGRG